MSHEQVVSPPPEWRISPANPSFCIVKRKAQIKSVGEDEKKEELKVKKKKMQHSSDWAGPQMAAQSAEGGTDIKVLPCWDDFLTNGVSQTPIPCQTTASFYGPPQSRSAERVKSPKRSARREPGRS